ncbi:MAG: dimethyl sulfoxide reductase anchor subunit [Gammaproteobacteria bacterium]|jgi:DMSO reductase anchor subunit|nr:dimethyl sulfoxide reductase anchor subunit [Gammaproteobacteria bacterium]MBT3490174.1 dimethyl sulfoxide reductase anchor subunit [Gammaproteobacteria bacterium]MBT3718763.1 dimethyl sulfoxide reductase anchor subunit [Gammaproteobacteria bacterium]MBT3845744.1 dimethyl sulfoxide reductase anchor subunit [Gammaproteobacteria bacterium]MBT3892026.1 dimethyl sulfoxide reductase anchor subunit [Gammaproteobacteria bacterium]
MHPAFSVIFLTTLIGLGQGLFLAIYTAQVYSVVELIPMTQGDDRIVYGVGSIIALAVLGLGLVASFFHLGHPERAWRSVTQWRTSWLSREVIALPLFMGSVFLYGLFHFMGWNPLLMTIGEGFPIDLTLVMGALATVMAFILFLCTAMIYASIRFLQEWSSPLTVLNFILLGGASGFTLATLFVFYAAPELVGFIGGWAIVLTITALLSRMASLVRNRLLRPKSTPQSAIGVRHSTIRQIAQGAMGGSFNTREYFHGQPQRVVKMVKWSFLLFVFPLPILLLALGIIVQVETLLIAAVVVQYLGLMAERWYFFAEANHPQNIYYQAA